MAGITYTASARAPLIQDSPAHTAGTDYSFDVKLQQYTSKIETPKTSHISLGGQIETVLQRTSEVSNIVLIWDNSIDDTMREFLYSIAGGEIFSFDPYGTIASPATVQTVVCMNGEFSIGRLTHGPTPWQSVALTIRPA